MSYSLETKKKLKNELEQEIKQSGLSNNKFAVERLGFKNPSKLSHVRNGWDKNGLVGDDTWRMIDNYLTSKRRYKGVATHNLKKIWDVCERAYNLRCPIVIAGEGGFGKTYALTRYKEKVEAERRFNVYYFDASTAKTRKQFVVGLMETLGCHKAGTMSRQVPIIREHLKKQDALIIIDEVSALEGRNVTILKDIMTAVKDVAGMVLAGTPYFVDNINKGASKDKHLYSETKDRLFMIPERLSAPTETEAEAIFKANGITGEALDIVMGRNPEMIKYSWTVKKTFRGIHDCITMIRMATSESANKLKELEVL
jgi:DNA transposition AAA+ family ATPase